MEPVNVPTPAVPKADPRTSEAASAFQVAVAVLLRTGCPGPAPPATVQVRVVRASGRLGRQRRRAHRATEQVRPVMFTASVMPTVVSQLFGLDTVSTGERPRGRRGCERSA